MWRGSAGTRQSANGARTRHPLVGRRGAPDDNAGLARATLPGREASGQRQASPGGEPAAGEPYGVKALVGASFKQVRMRAHSFENNGCRFFLVYQHPVILDVAVASSRI